MDKGIKEACDLIRELTKELVMCITLVDASSEIVQLVEKANRFLSRQVEST